MKGIFILIAFLFLFPFTDHAQKKSTFLSVTNTGIFGHLNSNMAGKSRIQFSENDIRSIKPNLNNSLSVKYLPKDIEGNSAVAADPQDSLALVALYNATHGDQWKQKDNWLYDSVYKWYGVTLNDSGKVTTVNLSNNNLSGNIPSEIGQFDKIERLILSGNLLVGKIPSEIGLLSHLITLGLSGNQLSDTIPKEIGQLTNLKALDLYDNRLIGTIPIEIMYLPNLEWLHISGNLLSGNIPSEIGHLKNLLYLVLSGNLLSGSIPKEIGQLTNLRALDLFDNQLSGTIPTEIMYLSNLEWLHLSNNQLSGNIPAEIQYLTNLSHLLLEKNQFSGEIPKEIGQLSNLHEIVLNDNKLTGNIPPEIGLLNQLESLEISGNQISGNIPPEIGQLSSLQHLYLGNNFLNGNVPKELGHLTHLQCVRLYNNKLSGIPDLPDSLAQYFYVDGNCLTFKDIEPNIHIATEYFRYSPQAKVGKPVDTILVSGNLYKMVIHVGGQHSHYQWFFNGNAIAGATDSIFNINSFSADSAGIYLCKVSNTIAEDLILESETIHLHLGYQTVFHVVDDLGMDIESARIIVENDTFFTDTYGLTKIVLTPGKYRYEVYKSNYNPIFDSLTIVESDTTLTINLTSVTRVEDLYQNQINIFPNPSSGKFVIETTEPLSGNQLRLMDLRGNLILQKAIKGEKHVWINLENLAKGIYILQIQVKGQLYRCRIVIQ